MLGRKVGGQCGEGINSGGGSGGVKIFLDGQNDDQSGGTIIKDIDPPSTISNNEQTAKFTIETRSHSSQINSYTQHKQHRSSGKKNTWKVSVAYQFPPSRKIVWNS
jgi:hypothetical protein